MTVAWSELINVDGLDERLACIDCLYVNIIGVNDGYVEWCPNDDPPSMPETLAWIWFIRPDLGTEIADDAPAELKNLISKYVNNQMQEWWDELRY